MPRYADPGRCPGCGTAIGPTESCPSCGLVLVGPAAVALWQALVEADRALAALRSQPAPPPSPPPPVAAAPTAGVPAPPAPAARRGLPAASVPALLLGLGAIFLVVAAVVFVAVTWGRLSLGVRTAILLGLTGLVAAWAAVAVRRRLRATAEALTAVTTGFVAVDLVAARAADLLGAGSVRGWAYVAASGLVVAGLAVPAAAVAGGRLTRLLGAEVVACGGLLVAGAGGAAGWSGAEEWYAAMLAVGYGAAAAGLHRLGTRVAAVGVAGLAALSWGVLAGLAVLRVAAAPTVGQAWLGADGRPLLAAASLAAAAALLRRLPPAARTAAAASAWFGGGLWVWAPAADEPVEVQVVTLALVGLGLVEATRLVRGGWRDGALLGAAPAVLGAGLATAAALAAAASAGVTAAAEPWSRAAADPVPGLLAVPVEGEAWWLPASAGLVSAAVTEALHRMRPLAASARTAVVGGAAVVGLAGAALVVDWPVAAAVASLLGLGVAVLLAASRVGFGSLAVLGGGLVLGAVTVATASRAVSGLAWPLAATVAAAAAAVLRGRLRTAATTAAAVLVAAAALPWLGALDVSRPGRAFGAAVVAAVVLLAAQIPAVRRDGHVRSGLELGGAVVAVASVPATVWDADWLAGTLTLLGGAVAAAAIWSSDRREAGWLAGALLAAASWVRLADAGVQEAEAYTLPSALALLLVGVVRLRREPQLGSARALGPGLGLAVLPSLLLSLPDPVTVRGLLTGVASLGLVAAGVALRWSAPLVAGTLVAGLLALRHLTPVAQAVPRWVLLAVAGSALLAVGMTWDQRRRDVAAAARYVGALR